VEARRGGDVGRVEVPLVSAMDRRCKTCWGMLCKELGEGGFTGGLQNNSQKEVDGELEVSDGDSVQGDGRQWKAHFYLDVDEIRGASQQTDRDSRKSESS